ncbi:MarR family transcriptional regulator [Mycobacterium ostraviense]|uniref:MarR family transcriptional regulator n=2 Tax=Mycobacterium ostraviense TaxID=2738409 RepID=A0A163VUG0_9MYCO|nr:MarR family transcriptional regulator [Mycobacterium ostraviense]KZS57713.1 MarR family transcriptional regulator [Mycobacterium ostraviense]UGT94282.1 MarR family transcriptional regulator [Mycobacterium ostraviense]
MSALLDEDQPLGYLLGRVLHALRTEVTLRVLDPLEVAFPEYLCMRVLSKCPGRSNAELARAVNVSPQAMNMVLRGLEARGLVTRPASATSGRSLPAQLTREGEELVTRTDAGVRAAEHRLLGNLTSKQRHEFKRILVTLGTDPH